MNEGCLFCNEPFNPSFEFDFGMDYWPDWDKEDSMENNGIPDGWYSNVYSPGVSVSMDSNVKVSGNYSVRIDVNDSKAFVVQAIPVEVNKTYLISGWIKTNLSNGFGIISTHPLASDRHILTGGSLDNYDSSRIVTGVSDWKYFQFNVTVANDTLDGVVPSYVQIECYASPSPDPRSTATGAIWCDDFMVIELGKEYDLSCGQYCSGGLPSGWCSEQKPQYCADGILINNCQKCGCFRTEICQFNGSCKKPESKSKIKIWSSFN
jgi:hypothetical protein